MLSGGDMDKTGQAIYVRLPLSLEGKLRARARKDGRTLCRQIVITLEAGEYLFDFHISEDSQIFFEMEGKNCKDK